jgi:hypothetical protein
MTFQPNPIPDHEDVPPYSSPMSQRHMMIDANKDFDSEEQHLLMDTPRHGQTVMMATPAVSCRQTKTLFDEISIHTNFSTSMKNKTLSHTN